MNQEDLPPLVFFTIFIPPDFLHSPTISSISVRRVTTPGHRNSAGGRMCSGVTGKGAGKSNSVHSHRLLHFSSCFFEFSTGAGVATPGGQR
ncbi:hypothetical protein LXL04_032077 [Taraxacum kok-saghyz]